MSLRKRVKGDYIIESIDSGDTIVVNEAGGITINGDLTVTGTTTSVETTDTNIVDNEIVLNSGEPGTGVTEGTAGILIDRGTSLDAGIRFNETSDIWEYNNGDGGGWQPFAAGGSGVPAAPVNSLQYNNAGAFGAAPITYNSGTGDLIIGQQTAILQQGTDEAELASHSVIYAKTPGEGETGLYVANSTHTAGGEELITKNKAIVYSIIF